MTLFIISIPLMVLGYVIGILPVAAMSRRNHAIETDRPSRTGESGGLSSHHAAWVPGFGTVPVAEQRRDDETVHHLVVRELAGIV